MSISQDLQPIVRNINSKKYFCFDLSQSKYLAKRLEFSLYQDSIIDKLQLRNYRWQCLAQKKDTIIFKLEHKVENLMVIQDNDQTKVQELNLTIKKQQKQIKEESWNAGFLAVAY